MFIYHCCFCDGPETVDKYVAGDINGRAWENKNNIIMGISTSVFGVKPQAFPLSMTKAGLEPGLNVFIIIETFS